MQILSRNAYQVCRATVLECFQSFLRKPTIANENASRPSRLTGNFAVQHKQISIVRLFIAPSRLDQVCFAPELQASIDLFADDSKRLSRLQARRGKQLIQKGLKLETALFYFFRRGKSYQLFIQLC